MSRRWQGVSTELYVVGTTSTGKVAAPAKGCEHSEDHSDDSSEVTVDARQTPAGEGSQPPNSASRRISYMPFSEGPRSCVGQSLAKMEVLTVLAMLLSHFTVQLADEMGGREGVQRRESTHFTLQTRGTHGIRMHLTPHTTSTPTSASTLTRAAAAERVTEPPFGEVASESDTSPRDSVASSAE
ncbi:MAG: hypothetical protein WDW38_001854 [Sanguina aurantia]